MLCRKFRQTLFAKKTLINNVHYQCLITSRFFSKRCFFFDSVLAYKSESRVRMSSIRMVLRDLSVARLWRAWTRSFIVNTVVKRCRRERSVREVFQCVRQTVLRPRRTFLLSATAAFKSRDDDDEAPPSCEQSITDEEMEALVSQLEEVERLSRSTLVCARCGQRLPVDRRQPAVRYCACKDPQPAEEAPDGWAPYMEADDVVIWRKEYKPGQGLYAYKVYGRYKEVKASDFAAVQVDGAYRRAWDAAVASLSVVQRRANGLGDQAVLHWEVLWPRLFANRDYVYIRRHKEFDVRTPSRADSIFEPVAEAPPPREPERPSVHARAKRRAQESERRLGRGAGPQRDNKTFVIVSRSCTHPSVPETKHAIRVNEYWSHMVVRSLDGVAEPGLEFVLTYFDSPGVGGRRSAVAAWATGRAAAAYLQRMRAAARDYGAWAANRPLQDLPDFTPFGPPQEAPEEVSHVPPAVREEQDMESSKHGPDMDNGVEGSRDQSTQTDETPGGPATSAATNEATNEATNVATSEQPCAKADATIKDSVKVPQVRAEAPADVKTNKEEPPSLEADSEKPSEDETPASTSWWRYLYPFYYFV